MTMDPSTEAAVPVVCDCCEAPFLLERRFIRAGQVFGLIVCTQCTSDTEDLIYAHHLETV